VKIVNKKEFLKQPPGILFSKYRPCVFDLLMIKGESLINDFYYQDIADGLDCESGEDFVGKLSDSEKNGTELKMDFYCQGRDGLFEDDQLFAVWSDDDRDALIDRLVKLKTKPELNEGG
jgi:hypothetical protein